MQRIQIQPLPAILVVIIPLLQSSIVSAKIPTSSSTTTTSNLGHFHPNFYHDRTVCRTIPGLTRMQLELCNQQPDAISIAIDGLHQAVKECQHQFKNHRWNCSSLATRLKNPYTSAIFQRGYRESAFAHAISAASVVIALARACSEGLIMNCGCDINKYKMKGINNNNNNNSPKIVWKWGGCSYNLRYGMKFSKKFLDSREETDDIQSVINLHNNQVGRLAVSTNMQIKCKCHGMSGSCQMKTCWRVTPELRIVSKTLKDRYRAAVLMDESNLGSRSSRKFNLVGQNRPKQRQRLKQLTNQSKIKYNRDPKFELFYYQKSPNYCDKDQILDVPGTVGRYCNLTSTGQDSCSSMCCGRGYNLIRQKRIENCNCKFHWCCNVKCDICNIEEWVSVCK